ncbi:hypothetical protein HPB50_004447 [Hyalomma asiaticum]|uniref:Uncharacterized protein n=1 Tax=Hyalomma asiaticum TaxID=266040 RepID=A0ACB7TCY2_HYAAI|nr:hypothetical protein HPB50_004447 [Hyalomma asiaticum]
MTASGHVLSPRPKLRREPAVLSRGSAYNVNIRDKVADYSEKRTVTHPGFEVLLGDRPSTAPRRQDRIALGSALKRSLCVLTDERE